MEFGCAVSREPGTKEAGRMLVEDLRCQFNGDCDFAALFFTPHHIEGLVSVMDAIQERLGPRCLIGCSCEGIIGGDQEVERQPGVSLLAGSLPGVRLQPFHLDPGDWAPLLRDPSKLTVLARPQEDTRAWLTLGDPYSTPVMEYLKLLETAAPGRPVVGGMASGGGPGQNILVMNDRIFTRGAVGLSISGEVRIDTVVSQGCRPIGRPWVVTRGDRNVVEQLGGRPVLEALHEMIGEMSSEEQELLQNGLFLGVVINEYQAEFGVGDFLIRYVQGLDPDSETLVISDEVSIGQTVQFQVRDAVTADEDLRLLMKRQGHGRTPAGGLIFSCNGRGTRMFDRPGHDVTAVLDAVPTTPLAGFFAAGELGPVGGKNFIHGHTASILLFREP